MIDKVEVRGIRELSRALKQVDDQTSTNLKKGFIEIASKVTTKVKTKVPHKTGRAKDSVKARGTTRGASIAFGGNKAPYYPFLDFGGSTGRGHLPRVPYSGAIKRPFIKEGRYVYPTINSMNSEIKEDVDELLAEVIRHADFDTKGGE